MVNLEPISDGDLAEVLTGLAGLEPLLGDGLRPSWFELHDGRRFRVFRRPPRGRGRDRSRAWAGAGMPPTSSTATVSIVTNVALDHTELLGPTREHIAREKAGIVKPGATLVLGETDPGLYGIFAAEAQEALWLAGRRLRSRVGT